MRTVLLAVLSLLSLGSCLASSILCFLGKFSARSYKLVFLIASLAWFILATLWARERKSA